jgi:hypothetical protein
MAEHDEYECVNCGEVATVAKYGLAPSTSGCTPQNGHPRHHCWKKNS